MNHEPGAVRKMLIGAYHIAVWVTIAALLAGCAVPVAEPAAKANGMRALSAESVKAADSALEGK